MAAAVLLRLLAAGWTENVDSVPTNTVDKLKRSGAPTAIAKQMKITYMSTLEAARFSTNARSRTFDAVSCRSVARLPPEGIMPLMMSMSVFLYAFRVDAVRHVIERMFYLFSSYEVFSEFEYSLSNGENSSRALVSNARSMVILPADCLTSFQESLEIHIPFFHFCVAFEGRFVSSHNKCG